MTPFALAVREPAERQQVGAAEEPDAVVELEPHAGVEPLGDRPRPSRCSIAGAPCSVAIVRLKPDATGILLDLAWRPALAGRQLPTIRSP